MKDKMEMIVRIILGLILLVFGSNKFLQFMPFPEMPEQAGMFMMALGATGYMFPAIAITEIVVGALLVLNKFKTFALIMFVPITLNILLFHIFLDIKGIGAAALVAILHITLMILNKEKLMKIFSDD